mgnify:FL=1|jgi:putative FmdB family regulatory protein
MEVNEEMPTYDYSCAKCGKFEYFQKITEDPLTTCPKCGGEVRRLISKNVGIIFKGSGFYITDHRTLEYGKKEKKEFAKTEGPPSGQQKVS